MTGVSRLRASALANPTGHYITAGVGTRDPPTPRQFFTVHLHSQLLNCGLSTQP